MVDEPKEVLVAASSIDMKTAIAIFGVVWALALALLTPWAAGAVLWLIESRGSDRFARFIFRIIEADDNSPRVKRFIERLFADRIKAVDSEVEAAMQLSEANRDTLNQVNQSIMGHGASISEMKAMVKDVPTLGPALQAMTETMGKISENMQHMREDMARMDERQRIIIEERRKEQRPNSPHRRSGDDRL